MAGSIGRTLRTIGLSSTLSGGFRLFALFLLGVPVAPATV